MEEMTRSQKIEENGLNISIQCLRHGITNQKEEETSGDRENAGNRNRLTENLILAAKKEKKI
jgi:hypothetical protein